MLTQSTEVFVQFFDAFFVRFDSFALQSIIKLELQLESVIRPKNLQDEVQRDI